MLGSLIVSARVKNWTRGDWRVADIPGSGRSWHIEAPTRVAAPICQLGYISDEDLANANLIAAAPALYDAVEQSVFELEEAARLLEARAHLPAVASLYRGAAARQRLVCAKARGETAQPVGDVAAVATNKLNPNMEKPDV